MRDPLNSSIDNRTFCFLIHFLKLNDRNYESIILYHVFSTHIDMQTLMYLTIFYKILKTKFSYKIGCSLVVT